jgi:hypothetical protein
MKLAKDSKCKRRGSKQKHNHRLENNKFTRFLFPLTGLACLIWFLVRVIPKPSRAEYPCMKVATPMAGSFIVYIAGIIAAMFSFRKARQFFDQSKYTLASVLALCGLAAGLLFITYDDNQSYAATTASPTNPVFVPTDPSNTPMGTAKGIFPGRVVWMWDPAATSWHGGNGYWWHDTCISQVVVDSMLSKSLRGLTGKSTDIAAWDTLFKYFNDKHGKGSIGYQTGEKIAIKINIVQFSGSATAGNQSFTSPQLVLALVRQLVNNVGIEDSLITFYDTQRYIPSAIYSKCRSEFPNVHFMGWAATAGQEKYVRDTTRVYWSEELTEEINGGHPAFLPTVVTRASYLINLANFKGHRYMGVTFCSKNHFGSLSCDGTGGTPYQNAPHAAGIHYYSTVHDITTTDSPEWSFVGRPMGTYNTIVDLMGHRDLGAKTLLFMIDALYASQDEGIAISTNSKWFSAPFNNDWTSSIFLSQDNVAIESVGLDFFRTEAAINPNDTTVYGAVDNYLHEAALANNPPSGTYYHPSGETLQSLGVHEHWNNSTDKQYTRNLSTGDGIELFIPQYGGTSVSKEIIPTEFVLNQNYPNPFNPTTTISYTLAVRSSISLKIYDALGRDVATLVDEEMQAGKHQVQFNAKNLSSGIYFYRLQVRPISRGQSSMFSETKKLVLLK